MEQNKTRMKRVKELWQKLDGRRGELIEQARHKAENVSADKLQKRLVWGVGAAAGILLVFLMLPSTKKSYDDAESTNKNIVHITVAPLQTDNAESWADFKNKVIEDGKKDKHFYGTMAYLRKNCNISLPPEQQVKFRRTYAMLQSLGYMRSAPEMQLLKNCQSLVQRQGADSLLAQSIRPEIRGSRDRERAARDLEELMSAMQQVLFRKQGILENRRVNKGIYKDFYDEKTGRFLTSEKSEEMIRLEYEEAIQSRQVAEDEMLINRRIRDLTNRTYNDLKKLYDESRGGGETAASSASAARQTPQETFAKPQI
nr:hypothetical protein [uncultured Kingella sp.]